MNTLPADVRIGLVSFNDTVSTDVSPTTDKATVIEAIDALTAGRRTALYDGIIAGLDLADAEQGARLMVLSDGGDTVSAATVDDVTARGSADGVPIDVVALTPSTTHAEVLRGISGEDGQFLLATDVAGLGKAFDEATGSFGGKVAVNATMPEDVDASGRFAIVTVNVNETDFTGTSQMPKTDDLASVGGAATTPLLPVGTGLPSDDEVLSRATSTIDAVLYAVLAGLIVVVGGLAVASSRRQQRSRLRVEQVLWYSDATTGSESGQRPQLHQGGIVDNLDRWMSGKSWYEGIDTKLDNGGVKLSVASWLLVRVGVVLVLSFVLGLLFGSPVVGILFGIVLGWVVTSLWLNRKQGKQRKHFEEELPDFLLLMASSLRSGLSFQQALDSSAADGVGEVPRQMRRAMREVQLGSSVEDALTRVAERMQNEDLMWTVTALAIQREVGGNLSNILETAAMTVKGRAELRREVRTLAAEGKLSGWVLAALPVGLFLYLLVTNRPYVSFFWTQTAGFIALGALALMFLVGVLWMRRVVNIEV